VESNRPAVDVLQCVLTLRDSRIRRIRNGGRLQTVERLTITSLEGEVSEPCGAEAGRHCWLYTEVAAIDADVLGTGEKDGEGNIVVYMDNVHVQRIAIIDPQWSHKYRYS
jgi:hypothetical protein